MSTPSTGDRPLSFRVATWNLEWSAPRSWRTPHQLHRLRAVAPDIAVLTETRLPVARDVFAHTVDAGPHPLANVPDGSKVIIASPHPMTLIDDIGSPGLPPHNFVAVDVDLPAVGAVRVIGVVIRWKAKRDYIEALPEALEGLVHDRTILAGDFNMSLLRDTRLERDLLDVLSEHDLRVVTGGSWPELADETPLIDHVAVSQALDASKPVVWSRHVAGDDRRITDHAGVAVDVRARSDRPGEEAGR